MSDVSDLRDTIIPKSDQLNADQLIGGSIVIQITAVSRATDEKQPLVVHYAGENGRPWKPCLSMRKILVAAWGADGNSWIGNRVELFNDETVVYGGQQVGGIRIKGMSGIKSDATFYITEKRGKKTKVSIKMLQIEHDFNELLEIAAEQGIDALKAAWGSIPPNIRARDFNNECPVQFKEIANAASSK